MTRWKKAQTETLILMHAHNQWSQWNSCILDAAARLGLPVARTAYPNSSGDGSWDQEYYTLTPALDRIGGISALRDLAYTLTDQ
jgi:hypothetical protein